MSWLKKIFKRSGTVPVVRLDGVIGSTGQFGGGGLTDSSLAPVLEKAYSVGQKIRHWVIFNFLTSIDCK